MKGSIIEQIDIHVVKLDRHYRLSGTEATPNRLPGTDYYFEPQWRQVYSRITETCVVKITTADVSWAGTDDDVTVTLAGRSWNLDNEDHDDFERGDTNTFALDPQTSFYSSDIHSVRIHKSLDGFAGGWKLKGVEVIVNGTSIYNNQSINRWLEDDDRTWSASI